MFFVPPAYRFFSPSPQKLVEPFTGAMLDVYALLEVDSARYDGSDTGENRFVRSGHGHILTEAGLIVNHSIEDFPDGFDKKAIKFRLHSLCGSILIEIYARLDARVIGFSRPASFCYFDLHFYFIHRLTASLNMRWYRKVMEYVPTNAIIP